MQRKAIFSKDFNLAAIGQIISLFGNQILRYALPLYLLNRGNQMSIHLTAYSYELFNASEIEGLKAGDILVIDQKEMKVETVEQQSDSWVQINGGLDQDGCDLCKGEDGLYFEILLESKSYQPMAELSLPLAENFSFRDSADPEKQEQEYKAEQFYDLFKDDIYGFYPNNTMVTVVNGEISQITRTFTP